MSEIGLVLFFDLSQLSNKRPRDILRSCFPEADEERPRFWIFEMAGLVNIKIDPRELDSVSKVMTKKSFDAYKSSWLDFVSFAKISLEKEPMEMDFFSFFEMKRSTGLAGNTLRVMYSHLNKVYKQLYNKNLGVSFSFLVWFHHKFTTFI